jgi:hypothetical protein
MKTQNKFSPTNALVGAGSHQPHYGVGKKAWIRKKLFSLVAYND